MKKLAMFIVFIVFGTIGLAAQDKDQIKDQDRDRDRIILVDGDLLQIKDRDQIRLKDKIVLNDGTIVNANGTYIKDKDQDRLRLKDGSCLDMDGTLYADEYSYLQKVNKENKNLTEAQIQDRNQNSYYIMNIDGELYQIKNQAQNQLKEQYKLGNGVIVNPDGTYQNRYEKQFRLKDGECLNADGQMFKNTYMQRKMVAQKNKNANKIMTQKKVQTKPVTTPVQKKNMKKGSGN